MDCHSGVKNGQSITVKLDAQSADFTNQAFIDPHYLAAGGTLHGKAGYQFTGQTYAFYSTNTHRTIGIGNNNGTGTGGPCIACHKNSINGHTFAADFQNGVIPVCGNCHGASLTADQLTAKKADYTNALNVLRAELSAKGFAYYSTANPRFTNTNWGTDQAGADTMGAAFNYALLHTEPGAYAHNSAYAKQLIFDSIDYLHNGAITGSIEHGPDKPGRIRRHYPGRRRQTSSLQGRATRVPHATAGPPTRQPPWPPTLTRRTLPALTAPVLPRQRISSLRARPVIPSQRTCGRHGRSLERCRASACAGCHPGTPSRPGTAGCASPAPPATEPLRPSSQQRGCSAKTNFTTTGHGHVRRQQPVHQLPRCQQRPYQRLPRRLPTGSSPGSAAASTPSAPTATTTRRRSRAVPQHEHPRHHQGGRSGHGLRHLPRPARHDQPLHDPHDDQRTDDHLYRPRRRSGRYDDQPGALPGLSHPDGTLPGGRRRVEPSDDELPRLPHPQRRRWAFKPNGTCDACHGYPPAPQKLDGNLRHHEQLVERPLRGLLRRRRCAPGRTACFAERQAFRRVGQLCRLPQWRRDQLGPLSQDDDAAGEPHRQRHRDGRPEVSALPKASSSTPGRSSLIRRHGTSPGAASTSAAT